MPPPREEATRHDVAVLKSQMTDTREDIREVRDEIHGLRRALWAAAASLLVAALVLAITIALAL